MPFFGRSGEVTTLRRGIGQLPPAERPNAGKVINEAVERMERELGVAQARLENRAFDAELAQKIDVTFPSIPPATGSIHPIRTVLRDAAMYFQRRGFAVVVGPEIEPEYYNFDALNIPPTHPAREGFDSFFITDSTLLRPHTSPMQIRTMQSISRRSPSSRRGAAIAAMQSTRATSFNSIRSKACWWRRAFISVTSRGC